MLTARRDDSRPLNFALQPHTLHLPFDVIKPQKLFIKRKLASVSFCKSLCFKTANIKILSANLST